MDENDIQTLELWIETAKIQIKEKKESLKANKIQIDLLNEENNLVERQILHYIQWVEQSIKVLLDCKKKIPK